MPKQSQFVISLPSYKQWPWFDFHSQSCNVKHHIMYLASFQNSPNCKCYFCSLCYYYYYYYQIILIVIKVDPLYLTFNLDAIPIAIWFLFFLITEITNWQVTSWISRLLLHYSTSLRSPKQLLVHILASFFLDSLSLSPHSPAIGEWMEIWLLCFGFKHNLNLAWHCGRLAGVLYWSSTHLYQP